jgi:antibiotic biosynthesis monooxygenase (ABM) superfamily enzyme
MVIYEVNLEVAPEIIKEYQRWLGDHIRQVLKYGGFSSAELWNNRTGATDGWVSFSVQYRCDSVESLETYLKTHGPRLRQDGMERFGERFRATRRILTEGQKFSRGFDRSWS